MSKRYSKEFFESLREVACWKSDEVINVCNNYFRKVETESKAKDPKPKASTSSLPTKAAPSLRPMAAGEQWSGRNRIAASQPTINWQDGCRGGSYKTCREELGKPAERPTAAVSSRPTAYGRDVPDHSKQEDSALQKSAQEHSKPPAVAKNGGRSWQSRAEQDALSLHPLKKVVEPFSPELLAPYVAKGLIIPPTLSSSSVVQPTATTSSATASVVEPSLCSTVEGTEKLPDAQPCEAAKYRVFRNSKCSAPSMRETVYSGASKEDIKNQPRRLRCYSEGVTSSVSDWPCNNGEWRLNRLYSVGTGPPPLSPTDGYGKPVESRGAPLPHIQGSLSQSNVTTTREDFSKVTTLENVQPRRHIPLDPSPYSFSGRYGRRGRFTPRGEYQKRDAGPSEHIHCNSYGAREPSISWRGQHRSQYSAEYYGPTRPGPSYWPARMAPFGVAQESYIFDQANARCPTCNSTANSFPIYPNSQIRRDLRGPFRRDYAPAFERFGRATASLDGNDHYDSTGASRPNDVELVLQKQPSEEQLSSSKPLGDLSQSPTGVPDSTYTEKRSPEVSKSSSIEGADNLSQLPTEVLDSCTEKPSPEVFECPSSEGGIIASDGNGKEETPIEESSESIKEMATAQLDMADASETIESDTEESRSAEGEAPSGGSDVSLDEAHESIADTELEKPSPYEAVFLRKMLKAGALSMKSECSQSVDGPFCSISHLSMEDKEALFSKLSSSSNVDGKDEFDELKAQYGLPNQMKHSSLDAFLNSQYFSADAPILLEKLDSYKDRFVDDAAVKTVREKSSNLGKKEKTGNKAKEKEQGTKRKNAAATGKRPQNEDSKAKPVKQTGKPQKVRNK
ncbi:hypothetical protein D918_05768 [Trichuris suis]|nr:hypothetical protein D918_05768 [Trichuris suis]